jgi:molybdopterin-guanine dinucleotide biosynthesis protein A
MGRDKALLDVDGLPAYQRAVDLLLGCGFESVTLIGGDGSRFANVSHESDRVPGLGPLGGIGRALEIADPVFVFAVDLHGLDQMSLSALLDAGSPEHDVTHARSGGVPQPLLGWWGGSAASVIERSLRQGRRSVFDALDVLRVQTIDLPGDPIRNINSPDDLR